MRIKPPRQVKRSAPVTQVTPPETTALPAQAPQKKIVIKLRLKPQSVATSKPKPIIGNARVTKGEPKRRVGFTQVDEVRDYNTTEEPKKARVAPSVSLALAVMRKAGVSLQDSEAITRLKGKLANEQSDHLDTHVELSRAKKELQRTKRELANSTPLCRFNALQAELNERPSHSDHEALLSEHLSLSTQNATLQDALHDYEDRFAQLQAECAALQQQVETLQTPQPSLPITPADEMAGMQPEINYFDEAMESYGSDSFEARLCELLANAS